MTKYCPACDTEYQDGLDSCLDDGELLLDAPAIRVDRSENIDIYSAANELEAEHIVAMLNGLGILAELFSPQIAQLPLLSDNRYIIAVPRAEKVQAVEHINDARSDGIISNTGSFL